MKNSNELLKFGNAQDCDNLENHIRNRKEPALPNVTKLPVTAASRFHEFLKENAQRLPAPYDVGIAYTNVHPFRSC